MLFRNRVDAGHRLAQALEPYKGRRPLILAIPRGAVPMGKALANDLDGDFDVVMVRKIGALHGPEFALGAVDESGWVYRNPWAEGDAGTLAHFENERRAQLEVLRRRRAMYTPHRASLNPAGRIVIVVDDGLATGATMIAALHAVRARGPERLVCAIPVASPDAVEKVRAWADEIVCLTAPDDFQAVGQYYVDFNQVTDEEVVALLGECK